MSVGADRRLLRLGLVEDKRPSANIDEQATAWNEHYDSIAEQFDYLFSYKTERFATFAIQYLEINETDKIADLGGGTGAVAEVIKKKCPFLKSDILVVDPSSKSIEIAKKKKGMTTFLADIDQFLALSAASPWNKYLICSAVHHFPNQEATFKAAYRCLPPGGLIVIIYHPKDGYIPLWKEANEYRFKLEPDTDNIQGLLEKAGFSCTLNRVQLTLDLNREEYYYRLHNRIISTLHSFTDEEINKGIKELDETVFKGADSITIDDVTCIMQAVKLPSHK